MAKKANQAASAKTPKHRSPNYPAITLEEALGRAKAIQAQGADRHFIPLSVAFETWKYKEGWGNQIAAALKAYRIAEIRGKTDKREIKATDAGRRIILEAPEKAKLLKEAALKPALHAELWKKYHGDPPADAVIRNYLVVDRFFNPSFVDSFISQFRKTIAFAGLTETDRIVTEEEEEDEEDEEIQHDEHGDDASMLDESVKKQDKGGMATPSHTGQLPFPLYLSKSHKAMLYVPASITRKEYDLLKSQIAHSLTVMEATILSEDQSEESDN